MKNILKFLGIIALTAVIGFSFIACGGDDLVVLAPGSQGIAGDGQIDGLSNGSQYVIQIGNDFFGIKSNGTIHFGVGRIEEAVTQSVPLDIGVYSIFYLENGTTYNVFELHVDDADAGGDETIGGIGTDFYAYGKNAILKLHLLAATNSVEIIRGAGRETNDTTLIFLVDTAAGIEVILGDDDDDSNLLWDAEAAEGDGAFVSRYVTMDTGAVATANRRWYEVAVGIDAPNAIDDEFQPRGARVVARADQRFFSITGLGIFNEITITRLAAAPTP
jgi:hypothetical protein